MSTQITCPNCHTRFNLEDVLTEDVRKSFKQQYEQKMKLSREKEMEVLQLQQRLKEQ